MLQIAPHLKNEQTMINCDFKGKDIISIDQFSAEDLYLLFTLTSYMKQSLLNNDPLHLLEGRLLLLFALNLQVVKEKQS